MWALNLVLCYYIIVTLMDFRYPFVVGLGKIRSFTFFNYLPDKKLSFINVEHLNYQATLLEKLKIVAYFKQSFWSNI